MSSLRVQPERRGEKRVRSRSLKAGARKLPLDPDWLPPRSSRPKADAKQRAAMRRRLAFLARAAIQRAVDSVDISLSERNRRNAVAAMKERSKRRKLSSAQHSEDGPPVDQLAHSPLQPERDSEDVPLIERLNHSRDGAVEEEGEEEEEARPAASAAPPPPAPAFVPPLTFPPAFELPRVDWRPHARVKHSDARGHLLAHCASGDASWLDKTAGSLEDKTFVAARVAHAVAEVMRMDHAAIELKVRSAQADRGVRESTEATRTRLGEARVVMEAMDRIKLKELRKLFHPSRLLPVHRWGSEGSMERLLKAEAGKEEAVFHNFVPFPRGPERAASYTVWVNTLMKQTKCAAHVLDMGKMPPRDEERVVLLDAASLGAMQQQPDSGADWNRVRWRSVFNLPDPAIRSMADKQARKAALKQAKAVADLLCQWELPGGMKRDELLEAKRMKAAGIKDWAMLTAAQKTVFLCHGASCNSAHCDGLAGGSCCVFGWKVFVSWDLAEWNDAVARRAGLGDIAPPLSIRDLNSFRSLRWLLVGPGDTIYIPADRVHFVVTLTSALLITYAHTAFPHRLVRVLAHTAAAKMPHHGTWMTLQPLDKLGWMMQHLRERTQRMLAEGGWDAAKKAVARSEWLAMRGEVGAVLRISEHIGALVGLKQLEQAGERNYAYATSRSMIRQWSEFDQMMCNM